MPPHCDSLDGPVVRAAARALDTENVDVVLPFVHADGEEELRHAFALASKARSQGPEAREVADRYFFETAVRIHRAGEGAPFTGLKPAGLDVGPVIPLAERAISSGDAAPLADFLAAAVRDQTISRLNEVTWARPKVDAEVADVREHTQLSLGLQVWSHRLYKQILGPAHDS